MRYPPSVIRQPSSVKCHPSSTIHDTGEEQEVRRDGLVRGGEFPLRHIPGLRKPTPGDDGGRGDGHATPQAGAPGRLDAAGD